MKSNKKNSNILTQEIIEPTPMSLVMAGDFNRYAKAVLADRAIPDVRDGMKPVQRRIIFGMYKEGNTFEKPTKKSATSVGYVMGHFHPHGDSSIYEALVRLSQDWKMEVPLVIMQGNNGSIDNDPAAASRYTEAKLAKISNLLVQDLDKNTVDMQLNFSDEEYEPTVLPARFPNLLVNGAQGIAVGAVTNIPTHNLGEVIDACVFAISHKRATVEDLRKFILGPDFPTGGYIDQKDALNKLYETGQASFYINSTAHVDLKTNQIIIDSIPYGAIKSDFVANLDKQRIDNNIDNILEIRDESTEDIRIVLDIKPGQSAQAILDFLRKKGLLKVTFGANMLAIDKGHPKTMNLLDIINAYIAHYRQTELRRVNFDLAKSKFRLNIVNALIKCVDIIDPLIKLIKTCKGKQDAKNKIMEKFGFDNDQAEAIVMLNLYKINTLDYSIFQDEKKTLEDFISELTKLKEDENYLDKFIITALKEVKKEFAKPRKTLILDEQKIIEDVDITQLIAKEETMVVLSKDCYLKRTNMRSYQASLVGDLEKDLPKLKPGDGTILNLKSSTHDLLIAFFASGNYVVIPVYQIPEAKWKEEGKHLSLLVKNLKSEDKIVSAFVLEDFDLDTYFVFLTKQGKIKRTKLKEFEQKKLTARPIKYMSLVSDDKVIKVCITRRDSDLVIIQNNGFINRYSESELAPLGLKASGVKAIDNLKDDVYCSSLLVLNKNDDSKVILVGDKAAIKGINSKKISNTGRLKAKLDLVKVFKSNPCNIIDAFIDNEENFVIYSNSSTKEIKFNNIDFAPEIGTGFKSNIDFKENIIGVNHHSSVINKTFKLGKEIIKIETNNEEKKENDDENLTLFSMFEKEEKK